MSQYDWIGKVENKERLSSEIYFHDKTRRSIINCNCVSRIFNLFMSYQPTCQFYGCFFPSIHGILYSNEI